MTKDFVRDKNPTAIYDAELPDYVKSASVIGAADLEGLADVAFADRSRRLHPVHTKEAALLSALYLAGNGEEGSDAFKVAKQMCEMHGAGRDLERAVASLPTAKMASATPLRKFALEVDFGDGNVGQYYPVGDAEDVAQSARFLDKDFFENRLPEHVFRRAARGVMKAAAQLGVSDRMITRTVKEAGQRRLHSPGGGADGVAERERLGVPGDGLGVYKAAADLAVAHGTKEACLEACDIWRNLDTFHGVDQLGSSEKSAKDPEAYFFNGPTEEELDKAAGEYVAILDVLVPASAVAAVKANGGKYLERRFGKEAASRVGQALEGLYVKEKDVFGYGGRADEKALEMNADVTEKVAALQNWEQRELLDLVRSLN